MILIVFKYLVPKGFRGITFFPFVVFRSENERANSVFVNHEKIHIRQQLELLIVPFFIWYGVEFVVRLLILKDRHKAYRAISFEKEAYENERDFKYLKRKRIWSFLKHL